MQLERKKDGWILLVCSVDDEQIIMNMKLNVLPG